jgi:hypothetical protein
MMEMVPTLVLSWVGAIRPVVAIHSMGVRQMSYTDPSPRTFLQVADPSPVRFSTS